MLVITDVKYDLYEDRVGRDYVNYAQGTLDFQNGYHRPQVERVLPRTYVFRIPARAMDQDHRVRALKDKGLDMKVVDSIHDEEQIFECRIKLGFLNKDTDNVVTAVISMLQDAADSYLDGMVVANRSAAKSAGQVVTLEAKLIEGERQYQRLLSDVRLVRRASFWQRLKWLFTGVQV